MSIRNYMMAGGNAALEDLEIVEAQLEGTPAEATLYEELHEVTEAIDNADVEVAEKIEELEDLNEAEEATDELEEKIDALTELVNDDAQDIDHVTELVAGQLEIATEMFTARFGVGFKDADEKIALAKENFNGSVDSRRAQLNAALEDAKEKTGGFKKWIGETIDKIVKWFQDFWTRHMTGLGRAGKSIEAALKKIEGMKEEFPSAGVKSEAPKAVAKTLGFIDKSISTATAREARKQYSILLNESPKILIAVSKGVIVEETKPEDIYNGPLTQFTPSKPGVGGLAYVYAETGSLSVIGFALEKLPEGDYELTAPTKAEAVGILKGALSMVEESKKFNKAMADSTKVFKEAQTKALERQKEGTGTARAGKVEAYFVRSIFNSSAKAAVAISSNYLRATVLMANAGMAKPATTEEAK